MKALFLVLCSGVLLAGCGQLDQVESALAQSNNTQRSNDINVLLQAVSRYEIERRVVLVEPGTAEAELSTGGVDICTEIVPDYLVGLPVDPALQTAPVSDCEQPYSTGYMVSRDADGMLVVRAPKSELGVVIEARGVR